MPTSFIRMSIVATTKRHRRRLLRLAVGLLVLIAVVVFVVIIAANDRELRTRSIITTVKFGIALHIGGKGAIPSLAHPDLLAAWRGQPAIMSELRALDAISASGDQLCDAWGLPLRITIIPPNHHIDVASAGADGQWDTVDDIR